MTLDVPKDQPRLAHQEILEKEEARVDHVVDVLPICQRIMDLTQASIDREVFLEGSPRRDIVDVILIEARTTLQYMRHRRNMGSDIRCSVVFVLSIMDIIIICYFVIMIVLWIDFFIYGIFMLCIKCMI